MLACWSSEGDRSNDDCPAPMIDYKYVCGRSGGFVSKTGVFWPDGGGRFGDKEDDPVGFRKFLEPVCVL